MVTCGGQATILIVAAITPVHYHLTADVALDVAASRK